MWERPSSAWLVGTLLGAVLLHGCWAITIEVGPAYSPARSFDVRVWTNYSSDGFVFPELADDDWGMPELQGKPSVGVALGGGGFRATIMSLGWIRGLHLVSICRSSGRGNARRGEGAGSPPLRSGWRRKQQPRCRLSNLPHSRPSQARGKTHKHALA